MKQRYTVVHEHRHGVTTYTVRCERFPTELEVIKHCNIDFEPARDGDVITITSDEENEVVDIP